MLFFFLVFPWFWFSSLFFLFALCFFCQTLYSLCCWTHNDSYNFIRLKTMKFLIISDYISHYIWYICRVSINGNSQWLDGLFRGKSQTKWMRVPGTPWIRNLHILSYTIIWYLFQIIFSHCLWNHWIYDIFKTILWNHLRFMNHWHCMYIYIYYVYMYICIYVLLYIYIYTYIEI